ncbi:MAG: hypothetical protein GY858_10230 [Candidatus Omnitrophica bacterium]|nr:hypothetical protein [Candidatus Omnitrophota bacterium]
MYKRHQVLLTDWLTDFIRHLAKKYDLSFSEIIRLSLSLYFGEMINERYPEAKFPMDKNKIISALDGMLKQKMSNKDLDRMISQIYFEARKSTEHSIAKDTE